VLTGLQILASFGMQWYVITYYGAGGKADALYTGMTIPSLISILLIESLMVVVVPILATSSEQELNERGWFLFASMGVSFSVISAVLFVLMPVFMPLLVPGFSAAGKEQTVALTQIQVFVLIGGACYAVLAGMYQVRGRFVVPPAAVFVSGALSLILLVGLLPRFGILWAAWVQVFNAALPAVLLLPALKPIARPKLQRQLMKTTWVKMRPLLVSKGYYISSAPLDRVLASFLARGSIAIFELAARFYNAVIRILSQGVVTPFIPRLSRLAHEENWQEFRSQYRKQLLMVSVPAVA
jgi:peptidoglycan biosynthesis protein MviN/MurJ (putative lipid II flippase)